MIFILITKIILLIAGMLFAVCSVSAKEVKAGDRCVVLATMFTAALVALIAFDMVY